MRENYVQTGIKGLDDRIYIEGDWYSRGIPSNVVLGDNVYIDTSYGFAGFHSKEPDALHIGEASGCYDRASLIVSGEGKINIGKYSILNGTTLVCKSQIVIGNHCMLAWGSVLTDSWVDISILSVEMRRAILIATGESALRHYPFFGNASPIVLEDNCWIGFDSVVLPGITIGRGAVIGCKSVVTENVPPYAVVVGNPARIVKSLKADDSLEVKQEALSFLNATPYNENEI